jgi:hypothetical protein
MLLVLPPRASSQGALAESGPAAAAPRARITALFRGAQHGPAMRAMPGGERAIRAAARSTGPASDMLPGRGDALAHCPHPPPGPSER